MKEHIPDPSELPPLSQHALDDVIEMHGMYLRGQKGGARCVLHYRNLSHLDFKERDLSHADFTGSVLLETKLAGGNFQSANFFACDMRNANLKKGNFKRADFRGAFVAGADLIGADLTDADMREGKIMKRGKSGILEDRKRSGGRGAKTVFTGAKMSETVMTGVQAKSADFSDADLSGVVMERISPDRICLMPI
jgi:uncharacterized protein YjbI with pentapeptide repeats